MSGPGESQHVGFKGQGLRQVQDSGLTASLVLGFSVPNACLLFPSSKCTSSPDNTLWSLLLVPLQVYLQGCHPVGEKKFPDFSLTFH